MASTVAGAAPGGAFALGAHGAIGSDQGGKIKSTCPRIVPKFYVLVSRQIPVVTEADGAGHE